MNHCYRLVFNASLGAWVAAPDFARGVGKAGVRGRGARVRLAKGLLAMVLPLVTAFAVQAQTWMGTTDAYRAGGNWTGGFAPVGAMATATFADTGVTGITSISGFNIATFLFTADAQAYTFDIWQTLNFTQGGIVNHSASTQTFNNHGDMAFRNSSSAANATIHGGMVSFHDSTTAGTATLDVQHAIVVQDADLQRATVHIRDGGSLSIGLSASGGEAAVSLGSGSRFYFHHHAGAGTTIGSLSGNGTVSLTDSNGTGKVLTIGGNDRSTTFSGQIAGDGAIVKEGTGTLTLTGDNTFTGGLTVSAGTLQVGDGHGTGTLGTGDVTNNAALVFDRSDNHIVANVISGIGSLTQQGDGTMTLTSDNSYAGATIISAGTLKVGNGSTTGSLGTGAVTNNSRLVFDRSDVFTVANDISGAGSLIKQGDGMLTLTGNNTYTGTTTISAGTLRVGDGSASGSLGNGAVINNGTLAFNRGANNFAVANDISGTGSLEKHGTGTITLTGNHTYIGTTTISGGGLFIGNGGNTGSLGSGNIVNNGTLGFNRPDEITVANDISGSGRVVHGGIDGTLQLLGHNTYTGGTIIERNGEIRIASGSALGSGAVAFRTGRLLATDTLTLDNELQFGSWTNVLGVADGHVLTVAGRTEISGGPTVVRFGPAGATGAIRLEGGLDMFAGTLDVNGVTTHISELNNAGTITSGGTLANVTVESGIFGGTITGNIAFTKAGPDLLILDEANTYTGATTITGGELRLRSHGALPSGTALTLHGDGFLQMSGHDLTVGSLASDSVAARVGLGGATLTIGTNGASTSYAGRLGGGNLVKAGAGTLVLSSDNIYVDDLLIAGGTLQIGDGTTGTVHATSITNNGTLAFNRSDTYTVADTITGSGVLRKSGSGTMELTGTNSYGGGTTIDGGTLSIAADSNLGAASGPLTLSGGTLRTTAAMTTARAVTLAGNGTFEVDGASLALSGAVGGSGNLVKEGAGTLVLAADNNYAGTTTVSSGTLQVGNGGAAGSLGTGAVVNNAQITFDRNNDFAVVNAIGGTGALTKLGANTMVLTGSNDYTGATTIAAGTLQVGDGGMTGSLGTGTVTNNGALAFNRSDTVSLANVINGSGSLTQAGTGNLVLTGTNTYTGGTFVDAGTLSVNGSIVGHATVNTGGALGGTGTVGSVTVASGGALAPGNSIGTLSVDGNLTFAPGSIYRVEANSAGAADRVDTVGAGTITINGGTVDVQAGGAGYQRNTRYTILSSGGATTGQFANATTNLAFLTPELIYEGNAVLLNLQSSDVLGYATVARTPNQQSVANYLQGFANAPGNADAAGLIQQIDNLDADRARAAFDSLAGSSHAAASQVAAAVNRGFSAALAARSGFDGATGGGAVALARVASLSQLDPGQQPTSDAPLALAGGIGLPGTGSATERGFWAQAVGGRSRTDSDGNGAGYRQGSGGFVFGMDTPVAAGWRAGAAVGYTRSSWDAELTGNPAGNGRIETAHVGLYGQYRADRWRLHVDATFAQHRFDTTRDVTVGGSTLQAKSDHRGRELGFAVQADYAVDWGDWQVRPLAGLRHARLREEGFAETGAGAGNLSMNSRTMQNTTVQAGVNFTRAFAGGGVELRAIASRLMGDNDSPVSARLAGQATSFATSATPLKRNALVLGTTLSAPLAAGFTGYADAAYEYRGAGQRAWQLSAGVRKSW